MMQPTPTFSSSARTSLTVRAPHCYVSLQADACKHPRAPPATQKKLRVSPFIIQPEFKCSPEAKGLPPSLLLQLSSKGLDSNPVQRAEPCLHCTSSRDLPRVKQTVQAFPGEPVCFTVPYHRGPTESPKGLP
jgi:hypothetical protein